MTASLTRMADWLVRLALTVFGILAVASCGSGGVSGPAPVNDPTRITILPAISTVYSGTPTSFIISGGTGSYIVTSSNQTVIPVAGAITGGTLTFIPNLVITDTVVTLTVRDTGSTPTASATVTVRPGTVANNITITPTSSQGGNCAPAICSGGDAEVGATLSQGGVPLPARGVRFDVVSGDFRFITSEPGASVETLATSVVLITDEIGRARARIRVFAGASNQTALLQVTDLGTQAFQRASFIIAQATGSSPGFFVSPSSVTFQGPRADQCASGNISATFYVFGGTAPYTISSTSSAFFVQPTVVTSSGGSFQVTPNGQCVDEPGAPIIVRDASGRTVTVTAANVRGTDAVPALVVSPDTVSLTSCSSVASVSVAGGTGRYVANSGSGSVIVTPSATNSFAIQRNPNSAASGSPVSVGISDGVSTVSVTVNLTGSGAGVCPALAASPSSVTLTNCTGFVTVAISGGSGSYSATSDNTSVSATTSGGANVTIRRANPSGAFAPPATVTVSDVVDPSKAVLITVNATGTGAGSGTGSCP